MDDVSALANAHRLLLLANDLKTKQNLIDAYVMVDKDLQKRCVALMVLIEHRRAAGEEVSQAWLQREARYTALIDQVRAQTQILAIKTVDETTRAVRANLELGTQDAQSLIKLAQGPTVAAHFNRINEKVTANVVAYLSPDAPLGKLLTRITDEMPREAAKRAMDVLLIGVSTGQGPRVVARNLRDATGHSLNRSLTIARTESLRAYRQASLQTYTDSDAVDSWQWICTKSARTCVACLAQDGKIYPKDAAFPAHIRCRCTCVPVIGEPRARESGEDWLRAQDDTTQNQIMGESAATAWRMGEVALSDFVGVRQNPEYGLSVFHDSLKGARERAGQRKKQPRPALDVEGNLAYVFGSSQPSERRELISELISSEREKKAIYFRSSGMAEQEAMYRWRWHQIEWRFADSSPDSPIVETVTALIERGPIPDRLARATEQMVFTKQANSLDNFWATELGIPGFVSAGTGGTGKTVHVYNDKPATPRVIYHEMAHNLATQLYGDTAPPTDSEYGKAVASGETAVSEYGTKNATEDFAESVTMYLDAPNVLKNLAPKRYNVIKEILEGKSNG